MTRYRLISVTEVWSSVMAQMKAGKMVELGFQILKSQLRNSKSTVLGVAL